jgi:uncharacterized membrane protein
VDELAPWLDAIFRWTHVVAGVLWIGMLYFFNWVNAQVAPKLDGPTKQKVLPELLPRALYFFRWGAAYTWVTGVLLLHLVYHQGVMKGVTFGVAGGQWIGFAMILIAPFIYDALWKAMAKNVQAGIAVSFLLAVAAMYVFSEVLGFDGRAMTIHLGSMFGTIMAYNVWFRIWPAQRQIIAGIKSGTPADAALPAMAGLRSKHNTFMSVPLIYAMLAQHNSVTWEFGWWGMAIVVLIAWCVTWLIFRKSASAAPTLF